MHRHFLTLLIGALFALELPTGCSRQEDVQRYSVPRTASAERVFEEMKREKSPGSSAEPERMLAAIVPRGAKTWFFKLQGLEPDVIREQPHFAEFIRSLRFSGDPEAPQWDLPNGWRRMPATGMRFATLQVGSADHAIELTVIPLATGVNGLDAYILANINRWREQLALAPVDSLDVLRNETPPEVLGNTQLEDGTAVTMVDMLGRATAAGDPHAKKSSLPPGHPPISRDLPEGAPTATATKSQLKYETVSEWAPGKVGGMRQAAFEVVDGDRKVEITVISLPASGGDRLANVNRWRDQMKLPAVGETELTKLLSPITVDGHTGQYVELFAPDGEKKDATLAALVDDAGKTWFFKLTGDAELAKRETARFKKFVQSVKFPP